MDSQMVSQYLQGLQNRITASVAALDGGSFVVDAWQKSADEPLQGQGVTQILEGGAVFERAGCGFSQVRGPRLPPSATQHRPELAGAPFEAMGVSLVFHPRNPFVPTVHMNVRMLAAKNPEGLEVCWFGGGMDLTPIYGFDDDAVHFHSTCQQALAPFGADKYPRREREFQLYRRGRYVEFNLVWDRGTHFGLQSGGRTESILLSMPPLASWSYQSVPEAGSPEDALYKHFLVPRDWV